MLLRSGILDFDLVEPFRRLVFDEKVEPADLAAIEMLLRAFLLIDELRVVPVIESHRAEKLSKVSSSKLGGANSGPIGDDILDYEFIDEPDYAPPLPKLTADEERSVEALEVEVLTAGAKKKLGQLSVAEIVDVLRQTPREHWFYRVGELENFSGFRADADFDMHGADFEEYDKLFLLELIHEYGKTLIRFHRAGAIVFSATPVAKMCHEYLFSAYPLQLFEHLDRNWSTILRRITGPGIGVTVPPVLAMVLSRVSNRSEISSVVRGLREEYASSRQSLWAHLEEVWNANTLKKQLSLLSQLDRAGEDLFRATFPERFPFLQTAWGVTFNLADLKPLSAVEQIGKALIEKDGGRGRVSAIGFMKQLSSDLRQVKGMSTLLRKILRPAEAARFGLR